MQIAQANCVCVCYSEVIVLPATVSTQPHCLAPVGLTARSESVFAISRQALTLQFKLQTRTRMCCPQIPQSHAGDSRPAAVIVKARTQSKHDSSLLLPPLLPLFFTSPPLSRFHVFVLLTLPLFDGEALKGCLL